MDMLRISATDIDSLRYYKDQEGQELSDLLARLRRIEGPTAAMLAGTALHKALEVSVPGEIGSLHANGYTFDIGFDAELDIPATREIKGEKHYLINNFEVTLVGKVDAVHGLRVDDHKYTSKYDVERFLNSYQWRIYLDMFGAEEFRWNVFEGREIEPKHHVIKHLHPLTMYRYPGLEDDVRREIGAFVEFARQHLPEKFRAAA